MSDASCGACQEACDICEICELATELAEERTLHQRTITERNDMRAWGDHMQSEASRLAESCEFEMLGYEAQMALVAIKAAVKRWTDLRVTNTSGPVASDRGGYSSIS